MSTDFSCCKAGFKWNCTPIGHEGKLGKNDVYITGSTKKAAVMIIHDLYGWTLPNVRLLADHFAEEAGVTVYVPDFFDGTSIPASTIDHALKDSEAMKALDLPTYIGQKNNKTIRYPEMLACAKELKSKYPKLGAIGYCYGGWGCLKLAAEPSLLDCVAVAHPSMSIKEEWDPVQIPILIIAPEIDPQLTPELKKYVVEKLTANKTVFQYDYYPGMVHGFAARGDVENDEQKRALERAKRSAVRWFKEWLF